jgi:16S rRNA (guanine1207-N2)-methyltransferase
MTYRSTRLLLQAAGAFPPAPAIAVGIDGHAPSRMAQAHDDWRRVQEYGGAHDDLVPGGPWATILFDPHDYEPGHAAEAVRAAALALAPGGTFLTTLPPRFPADLWLDLLRTHFRQAEVDGEVVRAAEPRPAAAEPEGAYEAFGCRFATAPGLFSPGGLDKGTALMLAHLLADLRGAPSAEARPPTAPRLLDLGCGAGPVAVLTARHGARVTAVDTSARALRFTRLNAEQNGVSVRVEPGDGLEQLDGELFDLIATNPPYHADFAVAKQFIEGAHRYLAPGGSLYLVVKRAPWYAEKLRTVFGGFRLIEQGGYSLFIAVRRERTERREEKIPATTRKHQKRQDAARKRRKQPGQ